MTVAQTRVIDWLGIEKDTGHVILTVVDDLDWSDESGHLLMLQEKLNTYLAFIESGEVYQSLANSLGRRVAPGTPMKVSILAKYSLPAQGHAFLEHARVMFDGAGLTLVFKILDARTQTS